MRNATAPPKALWDGNREVRANSALLLVDATSPVVTIAQGRRSDCPPNSDDLDAAVSMLLDALEIDIP